MAGVELNDFNSNKTKRHRGFNHSLSPLRRLSSNNVVLSALMSKCSTINLDCVSAKNRFRVNLVLAQKKFGIKNTEIQH